MSARANGARGIDSVPTALAPRTLACLSIALGALAAGAPGWTSRLLGTPRTGRGTAIVRAVGLRELAVGAGYFTRAVQPDRLTWLRVAGDALDFTLLASALESRRARRPRLLGSMAVIAAVAALDAVAAACQRSALART
jgi:hypothetical protein